MEAVNTASLLADAAAIAANSTTQHNRTQPFRAFPGEAYAGVLTRQPLTKRAPHDAHVQCYDDLSCCIVIITKRGAREPEHASLANLPSPGTPPLQGLSPHILRPVHLRFSPWGVTLTLRFTSCISYNKQLHPQHVAKPNSRCHLERMLQSSSSIPRDRRATLHRWSAFICHGQVRSTVCPCEIAGRPPQRQPHPSGTFKDPQNTPQVPVHQRGGFCGVHGPPAYSKCFGICSTVQGGMCSHCSKCARESEVISTSHFTRYTVLNLQERTQPLQYTSARISPHLHPHDPDGAFPGSAPLRDLHTPDTFCLLPPLYFSQASHH